MDININVYQKTIETLISMGHSVIQVFPFGKSEVAYYFLVHKFVPSMKTPVDDIQYNQITGINITDFMRNNPVLMNSADFQHRLNDVIENNDVVRVEFPNTLTWFKFGAVK